MKKTSLEQTNIVAKYGPGISHADESEKILW